MNKDLIFKIRQILNLIFILAVIGGVCVYFFGENKTLALLIFLTAVVFKMAESILRMLHK